MFKIYSPDTGRVRDVEMTDAGPVVVAERPWRPRSATRPQAAAGKAKPPTVPSGPTPGPAPPPATAAPHAGVQPRPPDPAPAAADPLVLRLRAQEAEVARLRSAGLLPPPPPPAPGLSEHAGVQAPLTPERRRELLGMTSVGQAILDDEPPPPLSAGARRLLAHTSVGRAILEERARAR